MKRTEDINLVVGAGFSGAVIAERIASQINEKVLVVDKKNHIGGNSYDFVDENGITVHKYGSHIFHTNSKKVWNYVQNFSDFNTYMHRVYALIDGIETTIPFNLNTLFDVFPSALAEKLTEKLLEIYQYNSRMPILEFINSDDKNLKFLAEYIYEKVFLNYTIKQWNANPDEIDISVTSRVPVLMSKDNRYFQDKYQGIPVKGYTKLVENMLNHPNIETSLETDYSDISEGNFKRIFFTGSIDEFFEYKYGILPYRSVEFKFEEYNFEYYQKNSVVNYPNNYDFTRIHEFKYYLNEKSDKTVIAKEYSDTYKPGVNERYYPIVNDKNNELYNRYIQLVKPSDNIYFLGRLGDYRYYDMDKAILRALDLFESIFGQYITETAKNLFASMEGKNNV